MSLERSFCRQWIKHEAPLDMWMCSEPNQSHYRQRNKTGLQVTRSKPHIYR